MVGILAGVYSISIGRPLMQTLDNYHSRKLNENAEFDCSRLY